MQDVSDIRCEMDKRKVLSYYSPAFSPAERNYCVTGRELASIAVGIKHFEHHLHFKKFVVKSDHASLRWLLNQPTAESQMWRHIAYLQNFNFDFVF